MIYKVQLKILLFSLILCLQLHSQGETTLTVVNGPKTSYIPSFNREGQIYFSLIHFCEALSVKYSFNSKNDKVKIEFENYAMYFGIKNPFVVIKNKQTASAKTIQLPTTTYFSNSNFYIPLNYILPSLRTSSGWQFNIVENNKLVVLSNGISGKEPEEESSATGITGYTLDEKANGTLVRIRSSKTIAAYNNTFKDGILTVIFRGVNVDENKFTREKKKGLIKDIQAKNVGSDCEIKFYLREEYTSSEILNIENSKDILITLHNKIFVNDKEKTAKSERWSFDVIVLDAGHGGKDHGAIGVNGAKEKDVNLAITLKLGKLIENELKGVKTVYTRKDDRFIELYKRGKIANDNNGKLFISIHCNSTPKKNSGASGFEVYLLRPGKTQDAIEIAETENAVIQYEADPKRYQKLTDENFILVSMAHSSYMKYSEKFAELLHNQFSNDLSMESRGVKQAGFYVLVGASMPSVLVESGFLSNKQDADYLKSSKGQDEIAAAIFKALKGYKAYYEKVMETEL